MVQVEQFPTVTARVLRSVSNSITAQEATEFLISCGGVYQNVNKEMLLNAVQKCIDGGRFIAFSDRLFGCWLLLDDDGVEQIKNYVLPESKESGRHVYIFQAANLMGIKGLKLVISVLNDRYPLMESLSFHKHGLRYATMKNIRKVIPWHFC